MSVGLFVTVLRTNNQDQLGHPFLFRVSALYCLPRQQTENSAALYFVVGGSKLMVTISWNTALLSSTSITQLNSDEKQTRQSSEMDGRIWGSLEAEAGLTLQGTEGPHYDDL